MKTRITLIKNIYCENDELRKLFYEAKRILQELHMAKFFIFDEIKSNAFKTYIVKGHNDIFDSTRYGMNESVLVQWIVN